MSKAIEGFYENETLEDRLKRLAKEWREHSSRESCSCQDEAYDHCASQLLYFLKGWAKANEQSED